jgi:DNA helicase-2/ATP-dependent DNA helicase PcrA
MATLYRSHFHALELQLELTRRNIPFSITSGIRFFEQAHLKDATAYLKLICNPLDELAFKRLAQLLPGIGAKVADKLWHQFRSSSASTATDTGGAESTNRTPTSEGAPIAAALQACARAVPRKAAVGWAQLAITFSQLEAPGLRGRPDQLIRLVIEAGYDDYLKATYTNYQSRLEDLDELGNFARQFQSLEDFLTQLSLLSNAETEEDRPHSSDDEQVRLSTIHQAKGLEFDVVFVIMLCDGLFPNARSLKKPEDEEEERRLFYVAITRARNELYLCHPLIRTLAESAAEVMQPPSRFLHEIPQDLLDRWNLVSYGAYR